eukprot:jgi/Phyca11/17326/fgenesh1_pg.PHYCAscaffold_27_\
MGNEQSTASGSRSDGVPFVCWQRSPKQQAVSPAQDINANLHSQNSASTASSYHFAEPSSFRYDRVPRVVTGAVVFTNPPKADGDIRNKAELLGNIAVVERGNVVDNIPKAVALCDAAENGHVDCIEILHGLGVSLDEQKHFTLRLEVAWRSVALFYCKEVQNSRLKVMNL